MSPVLMYIRRSTCGLVIAALTMGSCRSSAQKLQIESVYSNLSEKECKQLTADNETGATKDECSGVVGFKLLVLNDDSRSSITVVTPEGKEFPLDYWNVVTHSFSTLGSKAEWRVFREGSRLRPIALIVRVNYLDQERLATPNRKSILAVAKITKEKVCVVEIVKSGADGNVRARNAGDHAATKACLEPQP
jgi:hypothetical protein